MKKKHKITRKHILYRISTILAVLFLAYFTREQDKQIIGVFSLFIALVVSCILHKHFAPFIIIATFFFFSASVQQFWNPAYTFLPITKLLWFLGCLCLPIGIFDFWHRITFKYKIVDHE